SELVCDARVADAIRERKEQALSAELQFDPLMVLRGLKHGRPLLRYLIRTLTEGGSHAGQLIDEMVADAEAYLAQGERDGVITSSETPRDRAVLLVIWSMGALALHEHVERLLKDRKSTRLNSSHVSISYAVFCLKNKNI